MVDSLLTNTQIPIGLIIFIIILAVWETIWKLFALWKSARKNQLIWFIILAVVNTAGILPILYLFIFSKNKKQEQIENNKRKKRQ